MTYTEFQIMSDLHLETPLIRPCYQTFKIKSQTGYLVLLGDIGYVSDERLFEFLFHQLQQFQIVFFLLGNHEPYKITFPAAKARMRAFEERMAVLHNTSTLGKFVFLDQTRYDVSKRLTVLGCTLFSRVSQEQGREVAMFVTDFHAINDWTVGDHNAAHESDLAWLNSNVEEIEQKEPQREIIIFSHHSPTVLKEANDPVHKESDVSSAFVSNLCEERCWTSPSVKLWAWGHTHFNCDFRDEKTGKRCVANQKGYGVGERFDFDGTKVVSISGEIPDTKRAKINKSPEPLEHNQATKETLRERSSKPRRRVSVSKCVVM